MKSLNDSSAPTGQNEERIVYAGHASYEREHLLNHILGQFAPNDMQKLIPSKLYTRLSLFGLRFLV